MNAIKMIIFAVFGVLIALFAARVGMTIAQSSAADAIAKMKASHAAQLEEMRNTLRLSQDIATLSLKEHERLSTLLRSKLKGYANYASSNPLSPDCRFDDGRLRQLQAHAESVNDSIAPDYRLHPNQSTDQQRPGPTSPRLDGTGDQVRSSLQSTANPN